MVKDWIAIIISNIWEIILWRRMNVQKKNSCFLRRIVMRRNARGSTNTATWGEEQVCSNITKGTTCSKMNIQVLGYGLWKGDLNNNALSRYCKGKGVAVYGKGWNSEVVRAYGKNGRRKEDWVHMEDNWNRSIQWPKRSVNLLCGRVVSALCVKPNFSTMYVRKWQVTFR